MALSTLLRRCLAASLLALPTAAALLPTTPVHAGEAVAASTPAEEEMSFLTKLNAERASRGYGKLVWDGELAPTSRSWSSRMASQGQLSHDPNLARVASQVEPSWRSVGENVGVGYGVSSLHDAFMNSSGHRANILKPGYNRVGIGVVHSGAKIWVTVRFLEGPAISGSTGTPPPPPALGVKTALTGDFDGDGYDDLAAYNPGSAADELWFGRSNKTMRKASLSVSGQYRPVAGDFDGDGRSEILWYAPGSAADYRWEWNGSSWTSTTLSISATYKPLAGDFDGDGNDDILWYAAGTGADSYWYGNDNGSFTSVGTTINGTYTPLVGDFDGNGGDDLFWYAAGTKGDFFWYSTLQRGGFTNTGARVEGTYNGFAGDFDANGTDDIFWYAPGTKGDFTWYTNRTRGSYTSVGRTVNATYLPNAADFNGDRADDVVWFSPSLVGGDPLWFGTGGAKTYSTSTVHG